MIRGAVREDRSGRTGEDGFALLMVLLFLIAVTAILAPLVLGARTDFVLAANRLQQDRLNAIADGLLTVLARDLAAPPTEPRNEFLQVRSDPLRCRTDRYLIEARIQDQRGLVGINNAPAELLAAGFESLGFGTGDIRELVESLIAYRTRPPGEDGNPPPGDPPPPDDPPDGGPQIQPLAGAADRVNGGLKKMPFEAVEELYDFTGFRGRPVREIVEVFSISNTMETIVGPKLSRRLSRVLPSTPSPSYPFILGEDEDGPKTYRIDLDIRSADGGVSGYAGAVVAASGDEKGDFEVTERTSNPEFLPGAQSDFSDEVDCSMIFGAGVVAVLAADS